MLLFPVPCLRTFFRGAAAGVISFFTLLAFLACLSRSSRDWFAVVSFSCCSNCLGLDSIVSVQLLLFPALDSSSAGPGSAPSSCAPGCSSAFLFRRASVSGSCSHPSTPARIASVSVFIRTTEHPGLIHRGEDSSTPSRSAFGYLGNSFWSLKRTQFWCDLLCAFMWVFAGARPGINFKSPIKKLKDS
jgi:hypothetical protein